MEDSEFAQGMLWCELTDSKKWIKRRVETLNIIDDSRFSIKTSVDIDVVEIKKLAEASGIDLSGISYIQVPIARLSKTPELDLDVTDGKNHAISAISSDLTDAYTMNYVAARIWSENIKDPSPDLKEVLQKIISNNVGLSYLQKILKDLENANKDWSNNDLPPQLTPADVSVFTEIASNKKLETLLGIVAVSRELVVSIPLKSDRVVIKYCRLNSMSDVPAGLNSSSPKWKRWLSQLGIRAVSLNFLVENTNNSSREHFRIIPPAGARVVRGHLMKYENGRWDKVMSQNVPSFTRRIDENVLICYFSKLPPAKYSAHLQIMPRINSFFTPALISALLLVIFSVSALLVKIHPNTSDGENDFASAVTLLAALPSIFVVLLIRSNEHRLVVRMHRIPRLLLLLPALTLLYAAWLLALPGNQSLEQILLTLTIMLSTLCAFIMLCVIIMSFTKYSPRRILT